MCGFVGCFQSDGKPLAPDVLRRMGASIQHRGPDDQGEHWMSFAQGRSFPGNNITPPPFSADSGFRFSRLSIQDLSSAGHQPMASEDGKIILVFNGEIYNAGSLRNELQARGVRFQGHSDTEVILRLYEESGWDDLLQSLEGMFAIAIADLNRRQLHAARDPFGIKPLYYWEKQGVLLIASEIKAFLHHPDFAPELAQEHLAEHMVFRYCAEDRTLLRGVRPLLPGHVLTWRVGQPTQFRRFWQLPQATQDFDLRTSDPDSIVWNQLEAAVKSQLISDVPLGTQLSGGIDSSLVTLCASSAITSTGGQMPAYSTLFEDARFSEAPWIREAAEKTGVLSKCHLLTSQTFAENLELCTWHLDAPIGQPNAVALFELARHASYDVKVLLTGEGCDEVFAGYNRFYYAALQQRYSSLFRLGAKWEGLVQGRWWRLLGQAGRSWEHQAVIGSAYGTTHTLEPLMPDIRLDEAVHERVAHLEQLAGTPLQRQRRYEVETYLPDLLMRQDKTMMAHGIETRVPFLDTQLAKTAASLKESDLVSPCLGPNARMRGTKRIIKRITAKSFGARFAYRRKQGFDIPLADFFTAPAFRQRFEEKWLPGIKKRGLAQGQSVQVLWQAVLSKAANRGAAAAALWPLLTLEIWAETVLDERVAKAENLKFS